LNLLTHYPVLMLIVAGVAASLLLGQGVIGTLIARIGNGDLQRESAMGYDVFLRTPLPPQTNVISTSARAYAVPLQSIKVGNNVGSGVTAFFSIYTGATMTTGITVYLSTTDDGSFSSDLGSTTEIGVQVGIRTAAAAVTYGAATLATITMASTSGVPVKTAFAIPNSALQSAGAGDILQIRIFRAATNANDLCQGAILLLPDVRIEDT
jgi:hypothetical protein